MQKRGLRRELGLVDAAAVALGAIIGAGIFVTISEAAGIARTSFILAVPLAAVIALFSGLSATELGIRFPRSGGTYLFARELLSRDIGFLTGWIFLLAGITASSTYVLAFAGYLEPIFPGIPLRLVALLLVLLVTVTNYYGLRFSSRANTVLVGVKITVLLAFVLGVAGSIRPVNLLPLAPGSIRELFGATALMFFAYTGFARPVTIAEEVKEPEKTLPASLLWALSISMVLYLATSVTAAGVLGSSELAGATAPLSMAARVAIGEPAALVVSLGALISITSVLLTEVIGLSRIVFAMARNRDLPEWLAAVHPKHEVPHRSILLVGAVAALLAAFADLSSLLAASSLALLLYYGITNFTALRLGSEKIYSPAISVLGFILTLAMAVTLPASTLLTNAVVITVGALYYYGIRPRLIQGRHR